MPLIKLQTTVPLSDEKQQELLASLSRLIAGAIGKPERYVMATLSPTAIVMSGQTGPAAFADVRSIGGLNPQVNQQIARQLCQLLTLTLRIPPERVYLNFTDVPPGNWGWNSQTFG